MYLRKVAGIAFCFALAGGRPAFAQARTSSHAFADAGIMAEHDPTQFFYGSAASVAGRGAVGLQMSQQSNLRFEVDVPRWRAMDTASSHVAVRTVSYAFLYARQLPVTQRVQASLVAGGAIEDRAYQAVSSSDKDWFAAVLGVDAEVALTPHLALTPQFRFHTFPYPEVSIARAGVALRWHF